MTTLTQLAADREVLFIGGKGGVGKTAVASALALAQARAGRQATVVSTDPAHNLGHLWQRPVGDRPVQLAPGLRGVEIDPARTTDEHLKAVRSTMQRLMPEHLRGEVKKHLELARDAPGTHEAAVLERVAEVVENCAEGELVVFDTAPSGHTSRLVALPELMQAWTEGLLRRQDRSARFGAALRGLEGDRGDGRAAGLIGIGPRYGAQPGSRAAAAPDLRGDERDAAGAGGDERGAGGTEAGTACAAPGGPVGGPDRRARRDAEIKSILDRRQERFRSLREVLQDPARAAFVIVLAAERLPVLETIELHEQLGRSRMAVGALVVNKRSPADAGELLAARREVEDGYLAQLASALPRVPTVEVPLLPGEVLGEEGLTRLAAYLT